MELSKEEEREFLLRDAKKEAGRLKAMKILAESDDDCQAILTIDGVEHPFSSSQIFLPVINKEIKEIQKAVKGKPNKWE